MRWDVGAVTHLGGLTDDGSSVALAVSGHHVVGEASSEAAASEAVYFSGGEAQALAALGRWTHSGANDVNADGLAVGHESRFAGDTSFGGTAVMWCGGIAVALADLVSDLPAGWELRSAEAVNAAGQVVGYGSNGQETVSFLLSPVDQ